VFMYVYTYLYIFMHENFLGDTFYETLEKYAILF